MPKVKNRRTPNSPPISTEFVGFVAQELETVFPDMVSQREGYIDGEAVTDLRDVDVSSLIYALVNSVKQLKAEIEALKRGAPSFVRSRYRPASSPIRRSR